MRFLITCTSQVLADTCFNYECLFSIITIINFNENYDGEFDFFFLFYVIIKTIPWQ